jgi:3',5'-cyclic AMP phosphodiesterase CpdA
MPTITHITDLHFNRVDPAVVAALTDELSARPPSLLVVSGDLTQRARRRQYAAAVAFLHRLPRPQLVTAGNHDIPLFDVVRRFCNPLGRYRQYLGDDLMPFYRDDQLAVLAINTARPWHWSWRGFWKDGAISRDQLVAAQQRLAAVPPGVCKVVVTHHPFIPPPDHPRIGTVTGGPQALSVLASVGVELVLAGHLHLPYSGDVRQYHTACPTQIISAQAASATSTRRRGRPNAYNLITIDPAHITIESRTFDGRRFAEGPVARYERHGHS